MRGHAQFTGDQKGVDFSTFILVVVGCLSGMAAQLNRQSELASRGRDDLWVITDDNMAAEFKVGRRRDWYRPENGWLRALAR